MALWRSRVRVPLGPLQTGRFRFDQAHHQSEWYRGPLSSLSERGFFVMEDLWIDTPSGRIFARTAGSGDLILGLHGWSQRNGWHTWEPLMAPLAEAGYRVVSVDMPGWGQSAAIAGESMTMELASRIVLDILDALQAARATLLGKSWGGAVALHVALDHPQKVERLILTAPAFRDLDRLSELGQPVLLVWAEDDSVIPIRYAAEYESRVPDLTMVQYKSGGHSAAPKNAADFAPKAIEFMAH